MKSSKPKSSSDHRGVSEGQTNSLKTRQKKHKSQGPEPKGVRKDERPRGLPVTRQWSRSQVTPSDVTITEIEEEMPLVSSCSEASVEGESNAIERHQLLPRAGSQFAISVVMPRPVYSRGQLQRFEELPDPDNFSDTSRTGVVATRSVNSVSSQEAVGSTPINWFCYPAINKFLGWILSNLTLQTLPFYVVGALVLICFLPWFKILTVACLVYGGWKFCKSCPSNVSTTRTVKWSIEGFSEEVKNGFLTCPPITDSSGQWRLVIVQRTKLEGVQTSLGLLCTQMTNQVDHVVATVRYRCQNRWGVDLALGTNGLQLKQRFDRSGDMALSRPMSISRKAIGVEDTVVVLAKIVFHSASLGYANHLRVWWGTELPKEHKNNDADTTGCIAQEVISIAHEIPSTPWVKFVQHTDTRSFIWEIPDFAMRLRNMEVWGMASPLFFYVCGDSCSIWRMKLVEISGVFRIHIQLRGLPTGSKKVRLWYLLQIVDSFGDSVIPEHCPPKMKYPEYLNLWETCRHILYKRDTILGRYLRMDGSLALRISLQVQINENPLLETQSDAWLVS